MIKILGIESSCDETAVAIVADGHQIFANVVSSQIDTHALFGGVVPEVASRLHVQAIGIVLKQALLKAGFSLSEMDAIAVTQGPGLAGCLHIGVQAAKTLSWITGKPLVGVQHILAHIIANRLEQPLQFPLLALVVSGGHSELIYMESPLTYRYLGGTQDDAAGEAFDKSARVLGLPYPGGVSIDKKAKQGTPRYPLPKVHTEKPLDFSFSGIKTAMINLVNQKKQQGTLVIADAAASIQKAIVDQLLEKTRTALEQVAVKQVVLAGGVAANSELRERFAVELAAAGVEVVLPPLYCCTDNAAMVAAAAYDKYLAGDFADLSMAADPSYEL